MDRPSLNVYRYAAALAYRRLLWDLRWQSWSSRRALKKIRNAYAGEKAVILCNGPSLNKVDFDLLKGVYTFGLNKINLLFDRTDFRPSSIVAVNSKVIEQNIDFYNNTDIPLFIDSHALKLGLKPAESKINLHTVDIPSFALDCSYSLFQGYTVTYVAMQIAYHMGFKHVALVGCDHYFGEVNKPNETLEAHGHDQWHFNSDYFTNGVSWDAPDLRQSEISYLLAKSVYEKNRRKLINATSGGSLELLPKINLRDFLEL